MNSAFQPVLEDLVRSYESGNVRFNSDADSGTFLSVISDPDFKSFIMDSIDVSGEERKKNLMDILTSVCILNDTETETEVALRNMAATRGGWSYGLCLLCGIGGPKDEKEALRILSETDGPVGRYYSLLYDNSFSLDTVITHMIFEHLKKSDTKELSDTILSLNDSQKSFRNKDYFGYSLDLASAVSILTSRSEPDDLNRLFERSMVGHPYSTSCVIYHIARSHVFGRMDSVSENSKAKMRLSDLHNSVKHMLQNILRSGSPKAFIVNNRPDRWDLGCIPITTKEFNMRLYDYGMTLPFYTGMRILGKIVPDVLDPVKMLCHPIVPEMKDGQISEEDAEILNRLCDDMVPSAFYCVSECFSPVSEERMYWLRTAARFGYPKAQEELAKCLCIKGDPEYRFWIQLLEETAILGISDSLSSYTNYRSQGTSLVYSRPGIETETIVRMWHMESKCKRRNKRLFFKRKNMVKCKSCHAMNPKGVEYCIECGHPLR